MKFTGRFFKTIIIAFSTYSKIPMPGFVWKEEDMKYHLWAFPLVGVVIGITELLWAYIASKTGITSSAITLVKIVIPVLITGGLHLDGFMDTMDALKSYKSREEKLKILSDPHNGAFSIISLLVYFMLSYACIDNLKSVAGIVCFSMCFAASRAACGIIILTMPKAKKNGMLADETENAVVKIVVPVLAVFLILSFAGIFSYSLGYGLAIVVGEVIFTLIYKRMVMKEFGGVSGDLAGYYVCMFELTSIIMMAASQMAGFTY